MSRWPSSHPNPAMQLQIKTLNFYCAIADLARSWTTRSFVRCRFGPADFPLSRMQMRGKNGAKNFAFALLCRASATVLCQRVKKFGGNEGRF